MHTAAQATASTPDVPGCTFDALQYTDITPQVIVPTVLRRPVIEIEYKSFEGRFGSLILFNSTRI